MTSSLAQQLKRLSVPSTALSCHGPSKQRASLLFDSKEAAMLDREQVFNIGINGLTELENVNRNFGKYERILFSQSSMTLDRTLQSKEVNSQISDAIKEFLAAVSPYFLMKAAQKCLEWLIYRFYIHKMNVDDFVLCILPHHDSDMFPRALKLMKLDDPTSTWHFLSECSKMNIPLPRRVLLNRCKKDPGFLSFMCNHLTSQIAKFDLGEDTSAARLSLNLYTVLLLGVINKRIEINENLVKIVVMNVEKGLKSTNREQKASNYMILAQLTSIVVPLKSEVTLRLISVLLKYIEPSLSKEAILCLNVVLQNQKIETLPDTLLTSVAALLEDLPFDEVCSGVRSALNRLLFPQTNEEMATDETDHTSSALNDLNHRKSSRRIAAVKQLAQMVAEGNHTLSAEFISDLFLNRLRDDDHKVVQAVLDLDEKLVMNVEKTKLSMALVDLIETKYRSSKWQQEVQSAVKMLCTSGVSQNSSGLTSLLLGWLLITETDSIEKDLICARMLLSSDIAKEDCVIKALPTSDLCNILKETAQENSGDSVVDQLKEYNVKLVSSLADILVNLNETEFRKTMDHLMHLEHARSSRAHFVLVASLTVALSNSPKESAGSKDRRLSSASFLLKLYENELASETKESSAEDEKALDRSLAENLVPWLLVLRETSGLPVGLIQWSILQMITVLKSYSLSGDDLYADRSEPLVTILVKTLEIIADKTQRELLSRFQMDIDQLSQLRILMMLMSEIFDLEGRDSAWVPGGIYLILFKMLPCLCNETWTLEYMMTQPVFPGLILCLQSSHQDVRIGAVRCLQKFRKHYRLSEETDAGGRLKHLLRRKDFVMVDREFTSAVGFEFFRCLPSLSAQQKFVSHLVDLVVRSSEPFVANTAKNCFKDLKVEGEHISHELTVSEGGSVAVRKESGKKRAKVVKNLDAVAYRRIIFILEVLEMRKKFRSAAETMGLLFRFLSRLVSVNDEKADHCRQLTLSCLCGICKRWQSKDLSIVKDNLNKKHFDVESLRYCISDSINSQVQQQALTLLSFIAPLYPEYVLTNAVAIFTFMGTNLVQLDNSYTFHVIISTIDAVMSAVVNAQPSAESDQGTNQVLINLISIFVDARDHIPGHRRLPLFHHLVERVGVEAYLWYLIVLIMDSSVRKVDPKQTVEDKTVSVNKDIELIGNICVHFSVNIQLMTATKIIVFLQSLLSALSKGTSEQLPILADSPVKSFLGLLVHLSRAVLEILGRKELIIEVLKRSEGRKVDKILENLLRDLILQSLKFLTEATRLQGGAQVKNVPPKFWPVLVGKIPKILHKATYLLPTVSFLEVVQSLLDHEVPSVQLRSFEILIGKVSPPTEGPGKVLAMDMGSLTSEETVSLTKLILKLASLVNSDEAKCKQMALYCIQVLCARLGKDKPHLFVSVVPVVIETATARNLPSLVFDVGLTCLSEMCRTLGSRYLLKYLQTMMSPTIALLDDDEFLIRCNETTIICILVAVKEIIKCFAEMLDTYITKLLCFICTFPALFTKNSTCADRHKVDELLKSIANEMATRLESRVLLPKAVETFKLLLESNQVSLSKFFGFIRLHISERSTELRRKSDDLLVNLVELFDEGMNLRSQATALTWDQMLTVETEMIEAVYAMVLPLTDVQFSTIFQKFFSYVATEKSPEYKLRLLTFFHLSDSLCAKLQDLFIKYALHVLTAATEFLVENCGMKQLSWFSGDDADKKTCLMLDYVIGCLHKCLVFDKDGSFAVKCVKKVMLPIVEQLENFVGGESEYKRRMTQCVVPCIGQLAIAAKKAGTWKDLSYQVCLKSRNSSATVRIASLLAIEEIARKMGQEYDALVPETMPFLAELLEDDDNTVTEECRRVKGVIEDIIGELLNDCFE